MSLRVYRVKQHSTVLGPGSRAIVWFQGCALDCPGCIAFEMNRTKDYRLLDPVELAEELMAVPDIEGITLSGGDPFDQPLQPLLAFLARLRSESQLSVMCYTGRTLEELTTGERAGVHLRILSHVDLLVDGPYVERLNDGHLWRGSSNQRFWFLSPRYRHLKGLIEGAQDRSLEIELSPENVLSIAGIPQPGFLSRLGEQLNDSGVELSIGRDR